jgi:cytochrome c-type biogenesis protein CcmF
MGTPIGSPDVHTTVSHDLYLSLMSIDRRTQTAGIHAFHNPLIVWIWIGSGIIALGSLIAAWPAARRSSVPAALPAADAVAAGK